MSTHERFVSYQLQRGSPIGPITRKYFTASGSEPRTLFMANRFSEVVDPMRAFICYAEEKANTAHLSPFGVTQ